jgi:Phosphoserine phosphatase RsbU, N-terminal domain
VAVSQFLGARAAFRTRYAAGLEAYGADPSELTLLDAYELGRDAVSLGLAIVDVVDVHNDALENAVDGGRLTSVREAVVVGPFLLESLCAFEMVRRGFDEACEVAKLERQRSRLLRRLSTVLSDDALTDPDSLPEALQLVAEQARELSGAERCIVATAAACVQAASSAQDLDDPLELEGRAKACASAVKGDAFRVSLKSLAGVEIGALIASPASGSRFGPRQEKVLIQIAEMASAAIERAQPYHLEPYPR